MDAIKRASFASRQIRAGPAPLASFEDLPSDELESPEDLTEVPMHISSAIEDESGSHDLQFTTPDSLTISSQSTPRIESDFDSHFTLTPGDPYEGQSSSELRTTSLSSLSKETTLSIKQKKGSALSLGTVDSSEPELSQRKSSWTDIFRSHNQNSAKSSVPVISSLEPSAEKSAKKKSREMSDSKQREKSKFLSIFKKKSNKSSNAPLSPGEQNDPIDNLSRSECIEDSAEDVAPLKITNGSVPKGKENESPKDIELCPAIEEVQNDLGKVNPERNDKIPDERKINRKLINISEKSFEKEYNILSRPDEEKQVDKMSKSENIQAMVEEKERESSESELVFEEKDMPEKKEDDFEAENLISQDMSEMDDDLIIEIQHVSMETPKQVVIPSRQQRLEVTTKPIERPRSTTPINCAPLEAFIQSVSPTFVSKVEKIKLSLPGDQFIGRVKSPKKSSIKSWTDFCESVLHSPRMHKRTDLDDHGSPFNDGANFSVDVPFSETDSKWAAFDSNFEGSISDAFGDDFTNAEIKQSNVPPAIQVPNRLLDPYQPFETDFSVFSCSCECHAYGCTSCDGSAGSGGGNAVQPSVPCDLQRSCSCKCHCEPNALTEVESGILLTDSFKNCDSVNT